MLPIVLESSYRYPISYGPNGVVVAAVENRDRCVGGETNSFVTDVITAHIKTKYGRGTFLVSSVILRYDAVKQQPCNKMDA